MSVPAPGNAPKRGDLPFLRRRSRPTGISTAPSAAKNPALADFLTSRGARRGRPPATPAPQASPAPASGLDLSAPAPAPAAPPASVVTPARAASSASTSLDLFGSSSVPAAPSSPNLTPHPPATPAPRAEADPNQPKGRLVARARSGTQTILTAKAPTVTLTKLQTGVGSLTIEAVCSAAVGDLRLGCAYQLRTGHTSTMQHAAGRNVAPVNSARPVIVGERHQYETIRVDLRQCQEIERLIVYGYSETGTELRWDGALVVTTFGDAKIELPLDAIPAADVGVLLSLYSVHGEFVLRAEMEMIPGSIRDACRAYGFDRITWLDAMTPVG